MFRQNIRMNFVKTSTVFLIVLFTQLSIDEVNRFGPGPANDEGAFVGLGEDEEADPTSAFTDAYVENIERYFDQMDITDLRQARSLLKLGKIALYIRLYRKWISSPITGHHGFNKYFPQPPVHFNQDLYSNCTQTTQTGNNSINFTHCIEHIFESVQSRAIFMFPLKNQTIIDEEYKIDEEEFVRNVPDSKFNYDMSVSVYLCYLTKKRLSILKYLPFCRYGSEAHQSNIWPIASYRNVEEFSEHGPFEPVDELITDKNEYECADLSFCPDPCCARTSNERFYRENKSPTDRYGYCEHSACSFNIRKIRPDVVDKHWQDLLEDTKKGWSTHGLGLEDIQQALVEGFSSHYCYVEDTFNDDFAAIRGNRWNLTCACALADGSVDHTKIYRFDVRKCVDVNECLYTECPRPNQECVNLEDGYECACRMGYILDKKTGRCERMDLDDLNFLFEPVNA